jgi:carotenoid 1,2-hydratase
MAAPDLRTAATLRTDGHTPHSQRGLDALRLPPSLPGDGRRALWTRATHSPLSVLEGGLADTHSGAISRGRQPAPGTGPADGSAIGPARSAMPACGFGFEQDVAPGGYAWWYVDGVSDDGAHALTIIAFQGSVFSPYYGWHGYKNAFDHCAINVALYGRGLHKWTMTERDAGAVSRSTTSFQVGPSGLRWDGQTLVIDIEERTPPFPLPLTSRIKGRVRVHPKIFTSRAFELDPKARHVWWPIAPVARIEVELDEPSLRWSGEGYVDSNRGAEMLEAGFTHWSWSRAALKSGAAVLYDVDSRHGAIEPLAMRFNRMGEAEPIDLPDSKRLMPTRWLVPRATRTDKGTSARVVKTLEDAPFYARSMIGATIAGEPVTAIHESLSLTRFANPIVKWMLPYKMPRKASAKPADATVASTT